MAQTEHNGDREELAAEYVLGTLDEDERHEAERRIARDGEFAAAVARWQQRLEPLVESASPVEPPEGVLDRVRAEIGSDAPGESPAGSGEIVHLNRRLRRWRGAAVLAGALAACLAVVVVTREITRPPEGEFVALLGPEDKNPAFVASVDLHDRTITVIRVGSAPEENRSFELWALGGGRSKPESLGLVDAHTRIPVARLGETGPAELRDTTFAVSLEPKGGSPTGQPTGPVVFTGKLLPASEVAPPQ